MPSKERFWAACLRILAAALGVFLFVRFLLPVLLPFLIGLLVALLAQRLIASSEPAAAPHTLAAFSHSLLFALLRRPPCSSLAAGALWRKLSGFLREIRRYFPHNLRAIGLDQAQPLRAGGRRRTDSSTGPARSGSVLQSSGAGSARGL